MKKVALFFLKPLSFLPALLMMYLIFQFSAQTGELSGNLSYEVSYKIVEIGNEILDKGLDEFLLAVAVSFPFYVYGLRGFPLMLVAGLICVAFACGDEYHQSFVEGRGPSVKDVCIDSIGAFGGILTVRLICWLFLTPARVAKRQEAYAYRKMEARRRAQRERRRRY